MPKLWSDTIEAHRRGVHEAILDTAWALVNERGPTSVTMSEIAERTGIGRATLYKYFSDVEMILAAWHHRQITRHIHDLVQIRDRTDDPMDRLRAAFGIYCRHQRQRAHHQHSQPHGSELAIMLHRGDGQVEAARQQLHAIVRDMLADAAEAGKIRTDVSPSELSIYCMHALTAADALTEDHAVERLVDVTLDGLRP